MISCDYWSALFVAVSLLIAACSKSAQFGFHGWLLSAMEGPTPVSALMHAATLVTAGPLLLLKAQVVCSQILPAILIIGTTTAVLCGLAALFEVDLKIIIAYSTCSQMGFAFVLCSLEQSELCIVHLSLHAVFKATLFMVTGLLSHEYATQYASAKLSGGMILCTISTVVISFSALMGVPFITGFYTKELFLSHAAVFHGSVLIVVAAILAQAVSVAYTAKTVVELLFAAARHPSNVVTAGVFKYSVVFWLMSGLSIFTGWCFVPSLTYRLRTQSVCSALSADTWCVSVVIVAALFAGILLLEQGVAFVNLRSSTLRICGSVLHRVFLRIVVLSRPLVNFCVITSTAIVNTALDFMYIWILVTTLPLTIHTASAIYLLTYIYVWYCVRPLLVVSHTLVVLVVSGIELAV